MNASTATSDMELELPKRLFAEGLEPQVKKINNSCRMELLKILKSAMSEEYAEVQRDQVFAHIMAIQENGLKFSGKLVHSFLCRELITSKIHEKWFVFARVPLRFSLQEFHAVTGLKVSKESSSDIVKWKDDGGFWSKLLKKSGKITLKSIKKEHLQDIHNWSRVDRLRLIYLCVIMGVIMGRDEKVNIPHMYIKLVMDLQKLQKFHWGLHSYEFLLSSMEKTKEKLDNNDSYLLEGFTYALQIWIMEAIPDFGEILGKRVRDGFNRPRCGNWKGAAKVSYEDIIQLEKSFPEKGDVFSTISMTGNCDIFLDADYIRIGEKEDERVDGMLKKIMGKFDWSKTEWDALEPKKSEMEEANDEDVQAEAENHSANPSEAAEDVNSMADRTGRGKRKIYDEGAESRKKRLLCERSEAKKGTLDHDTRSFIEGLFNSNFTCFAEKVSKQLMEKMEKMETVVDERMRKMENEVSKLKEAISICGEASGPSKSEPERAPPKCKDKQAAPKNKVLPPRKCRTRTNKN